MSNFTIVYVVMCDFYHITSMIFGNSHGTYLKPKEPKQLRKQQELVRGMQHKKAAEALKASATRNEKWLTSSFSSMGKL